MKEKWALVYDYLIYFGEMCLPLAGGPDLGSHLLFSGRGFGGRDANRRQLVASVLE